MIHALETIARNTKGLMHLMDNMNSLLWWVLVSQVPIILLLSVIIIQQWRLAWTNKKPKNSPK